MLGSTLPPLIVLNFIDQIVEKQSMGTIKDILF